MNVTTKAPVLFAVLFITLLGGRAYGQSVDFSRLLQNVFPEADRFSQLAQTVGYKTQSLTLAIFPAYREDEQIGVVFYSAPDGYSGKLYTLTVLDMAGTVKKVSVFRHTETPSYVVALDNGSFLRQFEGISLLDKMSLLIGRRRDKRGDVEVITGATDTSKPIAFAVSEARKLFAEIYQGVANRY